MLYLDPSAIVKLVAREPETPDLVEVLRADPAVISSALAWTEVIRAVRRARGQIARATEVLEQGRVAVSSIDGGGLLLAPGCSVPPDTPEENLRAVVQSSVTPQR